MFLIELIDNVNDSSMNVKRKIYITVWRIMINYFFFKNDTKIF